MAQLYPDDPSLLPEGSVIEGSQVDSHGGVLEDEADFVIVGSGAAGGTAARTLSGEGFTTILVEEGPWVRTKDFGLDVYPAMRRMFRNMGAQVSMGRSSFPILQGRCVGGSTTINSAIALRAPENVVGRWNKFLGEDSPFDYEDLEEHYDFLDKELKVHQVEDSALGDNNRLLEQAAEIKGVKSHRISRYDGGCRASASCLTGCRTGKKLSTNVTYVPKSLHQGGKIYTEAKVSRVETRYGRATGVWARVNGRPLFLRARRGVLLAASAIQTPSIISRSMNPWSRWGAHRRALGNHFQTHPGTSLTALFDRPVRMYHGATQGLNTTHFIDSDRFKLESLSLPPEMLCLRLTGMGQPFMERLSKYHHLLNWVVVLRAEAEGQVRSALGQDMIFYDPTPTDMARLRRGLKVLSEMLFSIGAKCIYPGVHGMPDLTSPDDVKLWEKAPIDPRAYTLMGSHFFGGARMGSDPRTSVVDTDFGVHGVSGLYAVDSSVFPTNLGVNPQHTIMASSRLASYRIAERSFVS